MLSIGHRVGAGPGAARGTPSRQAPRRARTHHLGNVLLAWQHILKKATLALFGRVCAGQQRLSRLQGLCRHSLFLAGSARSVSAAFYHHFAQCVLTLSLSWAGSVLVLVQPGVLPAAKRPAALAHTTWEMFFPAVEVPPTPQVDERVPHISQSQRICTTCFPN